MNWTISLALLDPRVFRIPTSFARLSDLAVERFMKLMHAIRRIAIAIAENINI
jgi:hypothetical protein